MKALGLARTTLLKIVFLNFLVFIACNPNDSSKICGFGSMFEFDDLETVDKFEISSSSLNLDAKMETVFDWNVITVDEHGGINLYFKTSEESDQYGFRIEWKTMKNDQKL
jgi:hypothetical protein